MKKLILVLVLALTLALSGCGLNGSDIVNEGDTIIEYDGEPVYTKEEVAIEIGQEIHDFVVTTGLDTMIDNCDNADTPDDIGGLGDTDCEEMIKWYADNWEEIYEFINLLDELEDIFYTKEQLEEDYLLFTEESWSEFIISYSSTMHEEYQTQIDDLIKRIEELESGE